MTGTVDHGPWRYDTAVALINVTKQVAAGRTDGVGGIGARGGDLFLGLIADGARFRVMDPPGFG